MVPLVGSEIMTNKGFEKIDYDYELRVLTNKTNQTNKTNETKETYLRPFEPLKSAYHADLSRRSSESEGGSPKGEAPKLWRFFLENLYVP